MTSPPDPELALLAAPASEPAPSVEVQVAQVAVDINLAHLDRLFDYRIPEQLSDQVVPGCRVKVRFAGKLRDGFVVAIADHSTATRLQPLEKVVSSEPVLSAEVAGLVRAVADHWCGTFADVVRLAVPPRHASTEKAPVRARSDIASEQLRATIGDAQTSPFSVAVGGPEFLTALSSGGRPRAAWQPALGATTAGDWARGFALAAAATALSGRGSIAVVPDATDLARLTAACATVLGPDHFVVLHSDAGPAARYRAFLAVARGDVQVVIGTRAAAFAPVHRLGLVALWDDGDDLLVEQRAPYPHAREVLALRASREQSAMLVASYARTAEVAELVAKDWLRTLAPPREVARRLAPGARLASDHERALDRDPAAHAARLPHDVFQVIRAGLAAGPVLVQVPRAGYLAQLVCDTCRTPVQCPQCSSPVRAVNPTAEARNSPPQVECRWSSHPVSGWRCGECGGQRWRAPVVGAARTAEELGKAFPQVPVRRSTGERVITDIGAEAALVVATPGAEPRAEGGYAAAILLDTTLLIQRPDLRAPEEALRRWWNATALVRAGTEGGTVMAVGPAESPSLQAFVRQDPVGAAERELEQRRAAGLPPTNRLMAIEGPESTVLEVSNQLLHRDETPPLPTDLQQWGPTPIPAPVHSETEWVRHSVLVAARDGSALVQRMRHTLANRSAHKTEGAVRIRIDPYDVG